MSDPAATPTATRAVRAAGRPAASRPLFPDLVRSEWTKLWTVRSTFWILLLTVLAMVGPGALFTARYGVEPISAAERASFDPTAYSLSGVFLAQLVVAVLGVLVITSEFATGSIRTTFTAAPQRRMVLAAKVLVLSVVVAVVGIIASLVTFVIGQHILATKGLAAHLDNPDVVRAVMGAGLYLTVVGLLALGLGTIARRTAGALAVVVAVMFILPGLEGALPSSWQTAITCYLPSNAGQAVIGHTRFAASGSLLLAPWTGFAVFCAYTAVVLLGAALLLNWRDAR